MKDEGRILEHRPPYEAPPIGARILEVDNRKDSHTARRELQGAGIEYYLAPASGSAREFYTYPRLYIPGFGVCHRLSGVRRYIMWFSKGTAPDQMNPVREEAFSD